MEWRNQLGNRAGGEASLTAPVAIVVSDTAEGAADWVETLRACGADPSAALSLAEAEPHLARQPLVRVAAIDIRRDEGPWPAALLARLNRMADEGTLGLLASAPIELMDGLAAALHGARVTLLCRPTPMDRAAAVSTLLAEQGVALREVRELDSLRLRRLADEVNRIARTLSSLSASGAAAAPPAYGVSDAATGFAAEPGIAAASPPSPDDVRRIVRLRRLRDSFFDPALFADPAWDMLLDLFAAQIDGDRVAVSSLCIAAAVPPTTALRWIKTMTDAGLFERQEDPLDGRRIFIRLSGHAFSAMAAYFAAARRYEGLPV